MRILGIDPGTARLGYAFVDFDTNRSTKKLLSCGIISTSKKDIEAKRLKEIREDLESLIYEFQPEVMAIEQLFFFKNLKTVIPVAQARGVVLELAAAKNLQIYEYTPLQVKQIMTGQGRAEKKFVEQMVMLDLGITEKIKPDDAVDAVAMALCYIRRDFMAKANSV